MSWGTHARAVILFINPMVATVPNMSLSLDPTLPDALDHLSRVLRQSLLADSRSMSRVQLSDTEQCESVRQAIDEGIRLLVSLKTYRNYVAPISFLPNEILAQIFFEYILISDPWSGQWTRIILVCRRWRDVAMAEARLWSWISEQFGGPLQLQRARRWLARSKGHPLKCQFNCTPEFTDIFSRNHRRIRTLEVDTEYPLLMKFFENVDELPIVEQLSIRTWRASPADGENLLAGSNAWTVPSFIVHGGAPRLHSLSLDTIGFANKSDLHLLSNLTHLTLLCSAVDRELLTFPSLLELSQILQRSPRLQELNLRHYIDTETVLHQRDLLPSIPLLELRHLELNMDIAAIAALLRSLVIPDNTYLSLLLHPYTWDGVEVLNHLRSVLVLVRLHLRRKNFPTLRSMCIESVRYIALSFSEQQEFPADISFANPERIPLHIVVYHRQQKEARKMLSKIMHAVPLEEVSHIDASKIMHGSSYEDGSALVGQLSSPTWRKLFGLLLNPVTIKIGVNNALRCMLEGALEVLRRGPHKLPGNKGARKLARSRGCPFFDEINLLAARHPEKFRHAPNQTEQQAYYEMLLEQLTRYQALDSVSKPKGERLARLKFDDMQPGYLLANTFAPRLFEVTEQLLIYGQVWNPVETE